MQWIEADPLPIECQNCKEEECYNCDYAGKRWYLPKLDELKLKRKGLEKALERLQRQIRELDAEIESEEKASADRAMKSWNQFKSRMKEEGIDLDYDKK